MPFFSNQVEDERATCTKIKSRDFDLNNKKGLKIDPIAKSQNSAEQADKQNSTRKDGEKGKENAHSHGNELRQDATAPYFARLARCVALPDKGGIQDPGNRPIFSEQGRLTPSTESDGGHSTSSNNNLNGVTRTKLQKLNSFNNAKSIDPRVPQNGPLATSVNGKLALNLRPEWIHECDGPCDTGFRQYEALYVCKICFGKKFCGECIEAVKAETLVRRDCCPDHEWYQAWPIAEPKWRAVAEEVEGGRLVMRPEWVEKVRGNGFERRAPLQGVRIYNVGSLWGVNLFWVFQKGCRNQLSLNSTGER